MADNKTLSREEVLKLAKKSKKLTTNVVVSAFAVTRAYAQRIIREAVKRGELIKFGATKGVYYVLPENVHQVSKLVSIDVKNINLSEEDLLKRVKVDLADLKFLPDNVKRIFQYAFLEMVNNAIDHSQASVINIEVSKFENEIKFIIKDNGIGAFKNVQDTFHLDSELHAIEEILKGKTTTDPSHHSGQGIFFTSKAVDKFTIISGGHGLKIDNTLPEPDFFPYKLKKIFKGTKVIVELSVDSQKDLQSVFEEFQTADGDFAFDKTKIIVSLYVAGGNYLSRSEARRLLNRLDKYKEIILDFNHVETIGQAFADEIFHVFKNKHPNILITPINMNKPVRFMIDRVEH